VLPEVKSNDGTTPSPSLPSAPSRISIHDVTKAFQQVPMSSSASSQPSSREKYQISPPTTSAPVARPTAPSFSHPPVAHSAAYYPSPMMTHPPAPILYGPMTSSPVPSRMHANGAAGMYNGWVIPGAPQAQGNMMRPVAHHYGQMMHYPSPGYPQPPHAAPNLMPPTLPQTQGRGRGMQMMSPVLSPAHAQNYAGSPVMMHRQHQNHGYIPVSPDHQPLRVDNGHAPLQRPIVHGFAPTSPFSRTW
jgi:serine/arginine repetitive matrix protein 2